MWCEAPVFPSGLYDPFFLSWGLFGSLWRLQKECISELEATKPNFYLLKLGANWPQSYCTAEANHELCVYAREGMGMHS